MLVEEEGNSTRIEGYIHNSNWKEILKADKTTESSQSNRNQPTGKDRVNVHFPTVTEILKTIQHTSPGQEPGANSIPV